MILFLKILAFVVLIGQGVVSLFTSVFFTGLFEAFVNFALLYSLAIILQRFETIEGYLLTLGNHIIERDKKQETVAKEVEESPQPVPASIPPKAPPLAPPVTASAPPSVFNGKQRHDGETVVPLPDRDGLVSCPLCHTVQRSNRPVCFNCNATFKK